MRQIVPNFMPVRL